MSEMCEAHRSTYTAGCPGCKAAKRAKNQRLRQSPARQERDRQAARNYRATTAGKAASKASKVKSMAKPEVRAKVAAQARTYYATNPARRLANQRRVKARRVREFEALQAYWRQQGIDPSVCLYCPRPFEHIDHFMPQARGGSNDPENLVPSCAPCNLQKHDMHPLAWLGIVLAR